jgi:D-amino peptidase
VGAVPVDVHLGRERGRPRLLDGGADEVLVNEAHWTMRNLLLEQLDERAEMLTGRHKSLSMVEGVQHGDVDGIAFVGYHAGAGMEGVLAHTYLANSITGVWLNDVRASEGCSTRMSSPSTGYPSSSSPVTTWPARTRSGTRPRR